MIKTILKYYILDKCINIIFDNFFYNIKNNKLKINIKQGDCINKIIVYNDKCKTYSIYENVICNKTYKGVNDTLFIFYYIRRSKDGNNSFMYTYTYEYVLSFGRNIVNIEY